jgi:CBS domain-containing membrane protein
MGRPIRHPVTVPAPDQSDEVTVSPLASLILRSFAPALPRPHPLEALRAALAGVVALLLADAVLWALSRLGGTPDAGFLAHPLLIAPFGASIVLIFFVPASPLAQPWSVMAGNAISALCAIAVLHMGLPALATLCLAVLLALVAMSLARALHPPGGAVAMATVLAVGQGAVPGLFYLFVTVLLGSLLLTCAGMVFHRLTGRSYPLRPAPPPPIPEPAPAAPSLLDLAAALDQLRLGTVIGVEDVARLIETADAISASHAEALLAERIMSRATVTVGPAADWRTLSGLFVDHGFRNLPVVDAASRFLGLIPVQTILRPGAQGLSARHLLQEVATCPPEASLADLLAPLAQGRQTALPIVTADGTLVGMVTKSDIVAALVHHTAQGTQG